MTNQSIKRIMGEIIQSFLKEEIDSKYAVEQLIDRLDPEEIYENDEEMIGDCYFAIKHLRETGFETPIAEIKYFDGCLKGNWEYHPEEKNKYILESS